MKQDRILFLGGIYDLVNGEINREIEINDVITKLGWELSKENIDKSKGILDYLRDKGYTIDNPCFGDYGFSITTEGIDVIERDVTEDSQPHVSVHNEGGIVNTGERASLQINSNGSTQINNSNNINNMQQKELEALMDGLYELEFRHLKIIEETFDETNKNKFSACKNDLEEELAKKEPSVNIIKRSLRKLKPIFKALGSGIVDISLQMALNGCLLSFGLPPME